MAIVSTGGNPHQFNAVLAHRPEIATAWKRMDTVLHGDSSTLPYGLKENARRVLSAQAGCAFCNSFGEPETSDLNAREQLAVRFADALIKDYRSIDESMMAAMREEFTEEELVEFVAWMCFKLGANVLGSVMKLEPASAEMKASAEQTHAALLREDEKRAARL